MLPVFTELRIQGVWTGRYKQFNTVCVQVPLSLCMYLLTVNSLLISSSVKIVYGVKIFLSVILQLKHSLSTLLSGPNIYLTSGHNTLLHNTAIVSPNIFTLSVPNIFSCLHGFKSLKPGFCHPLLLHFYGLNGLLHQLNNPFILCFSVVRSNKNVLIILKSKCHCWNN